MDLSVNNRNKDIVITIDPWILVISLAMTLVGILISQNNHNLVIFLIFILIPLVIIQQRIIETLRLLKNVIFVILLIFIFYSIVLPSLSLNHFKIDICFNNPGYLYILKIISLIILFQSSISLQQSHIVAFLSALSVSDKVKISIVTILNSIQYLKNEVGRIIDARYARGLIRNRSMWRRVIQLPLVLIPVFNSMLRILTARFDNSDQIVLVGTYISTIRYNKRSRTGINLLLILISFIWLLFNTYLLIY